MREIKYELREIKSELRAIREEIPKGRPELLIEQKRNALSAKPLYQYHLHNLQHPAQVYEEKVVFGYGLERTARKLKLKIIGEDFSRPTLSMMCIGSEFARVVEIGTQTKMEYCQRHGYNLVILESPPYEFQRPLSWLKLPLMFRLMKLGYQRIAYMDADTLITDPGVRLETFFERLEKAGCHLMVAEDIITLNLGVFFMLKTWQSLALLDLIYETDADLDHAWWEQKALIDLVENNPVIKSLLCVEIEARQFNSMLLESSDASNYSWHPGDFLCHCAGNRDHAQLSAKMNQVYRMIQSQ